MTRATAPLLLLEFAGCAALGGLAITSNPSVFFLVAWFFTFPVVIVTLFMSLLPVVLGALFSRRPDFWRGWRHALAIYGGFIAGVNFTAFVWPGV